MHQHKNTKPYILLVEDDVKLRNLIQTALLDADFQVICATDGLEASTKLKNQKFSMVVTDLNIPKKDGIKLANEIASSANIPVLLITGELENFEIRLKALDGVMLLPKPFKVEIIPALVAKILKTNTKAA
ncbi:response regulator [Halobacteriovorax sp. HLS]|uniref:response regulator n=1 Tax=Halobacteriovorax sp. HLS TaxID=2234000 RepID=UPI000FDC8758|nr:response regulator [Halobacteriovorax sp. HLS]